ncbi:MAG: hypothetical protein SGCHY_004086 [Lobulomycetales sp.]
MHIKDNKGHKEHHGSHEGLTKKEIDQIDKVVEESGKLARHHEQELQAELNEANKVDIKKGEMERQQSEDSL